MANLATSLARFNVDRKRLARRTGLPSERIDKIFDGHPPTISELRTIAQYLKLPADALVRAASPTKKFEVRYRKGTAAAQPFGTELRMQEISSYLERNRLVPVGGSDWRVEADLSDRRSIETAAKRVRALICDPWKQLDPLPDFVNRIDEAGLASSLVLSDLDMEGASTTAEGRGLIVVASRTFEPRMLFTCAHELAHIVLGHTKREEWLVDEEGLEDFRGKSEEERLCNALASAILQPAEGVSRFLDKARKILNVPHDSLTAVEILLVARYFCTSFAVAAMRLEQLEIAPGGTAASFEQSITEDYQSFETYASELGLPPRTRIEFPIVSEVLRQQLRGALDAGTISLGRLAEVLGYSSAEISDAVS